MIVLLSRVGTVVVNFCPETFFNAPTSWRRASPQQNTIPPRNKSYMREGANHPFRAPLLAVIPRSHQLHQLLLKNDAAPTPAAGSQYQKRRNAGLWVVERPHRGSRIQQQLPFLLFLVVFEATVGQTLPQSIVPLQPAR